MNDFFGNKNPFTNNYNTNNNNFNSNYKGRQTMKTNINDNNQNNSNKNLRPQRNSAKNMMNNHNNITPQAFIYGKFGRKTVVQQDLKTFVNKIKKAEWTTNPSYLIAKNINISPTFGKNDNIDDDFDIPRFSKSIDKLYLKSVQINFNDYLNYVDEIKSRKQKLDEEAKREKAEFLRNNFPSEGKLDVKSILNRIRNNHKSFISKDQLLYNKISEAMNYY